MPQLQNLVLTDRAATPVAHTYTPLEITNGVGVVVESSGVPVGNNRFSISLRKTSAGKYKVQMNLTLPIVQNETINGVTTPKVVRTGYAECTFTMDSTSTLQERKDLVGLLYSSLDPAKVLVNDTVTNLQGVY